MPRAELNPEAAVMLDRVPERMGGEMPMVRHQLTQMVPFPGKLGLMAETLEPRGDVAEADKKTRALGLARDAKRAYWMLLANKELRAVNAAGRGVLTTIANAALARYGAGVGQHHEVARAEVERNALDVDAIDLDGERVAAVAMMNALRNQPADAAIADPQEPDERATPKVPPLTTLIALASARRPELARMAAMQREEQTMAKLARRERYPDFRASVWYNQMIGAEDTGGVMLGATIPLFNVPRPNRLAEAAELRASSAGERAAMAIMLQFEVADALRRLNTATRTLELIGTVARPRAQQSFTASLAGSRVRWVSSPVYVDIQGRDVGSYVDYGKAAVARAVKLPPGYSIKWTGQYELLERVRGRLAFILPLTLGLVFVILYLNFQGVAQTFIVTLGVPFAAVGAIWLLYAAEFNTSIAVWVGMIALLGVAAETASVMVVYLDDAFHEGQRDGSVRDVPSLISACVEAGSKRVGRC